VLDKKAAAARTKKTKQASLALADQYRALELLFAHVGLLQLQEKSVSEATEVLQELQECYKNAFLAAPKKTKKKAKQEEEDEEEEPNFVEVLVDVMLSLLVKPSNLLRDVVKIVFASFCDQLTAEVHFDFLFLSPMYVV
jgi:DNA polymerase phi